MTEIRRGTKLLVRTSTVQLPGLRSHYVWLPTDQGPSTTGAYQVGVAFSAHPGLVRQSNGTTVQSDALAGAVYVTGAAPITWSNVEGVTEALEMYPEQALMQPLGVTLDDIQPTLGVRDEVVFSIACLLRRVHVGAMLSDIEASTVSHRVAAHLVHSYTTRGPNLREPAGALGVQIVERVADHIDARLGGPIVLEDLAKVASLSPFHFARAFKRTTGMTPCDFVTARRMSAATQRLLQPDGTVESTAFEVGYRNVSHFRRMFRRHVGVRPGDVRR